jgi:redox-sensitive bicupin YhaK (pirin superfamily)
MLDVRRATDRGLTHLDWLDSRHTFSFGGYHDPRHMGYRALRVINDDRVAPGGGFGTHAHRDMEIVTYVLNGALEHRDSLGTGSVIRAGDVQKMSAGSGIRHSEFNHSKSAPVHFLQIWILPQRAGIEPGYEQLAFDRTSKLGRFRLIASDERRDDAIHLHQDARMYAAVLDATATLADYELAADRYGWLQVAHGSVEFDGRTLAAGDGVAIAGGTRIDVRAAPEGEILLFDLA